MYNCRYRARPLLLGGVLAILAIAPALAIGGPPLASGPERATNDPYYNTLNNPSSGGYRQPDSGRVEKRKGCKFYNPYVPFQNEPYCQ